MSNEKQFIDGLRFSKPHEKAPDFVKGSLGIKVDDFKKFIDQHQKNGWVNIDLKESKQGNYYAELNTYNPGERQAEKKENNEEDFNINQIPF